MPIVLNAEVEIFSLSDIHRAVKIAKNRFQDDAHKKRTRDFCLEFFGVKQPNHLLKKEFFTGLDMPAHVNNPVEMFYFINALNFEELINTSIFLDAVAWLIIFSDQQQEKNWWPSILSKGLMLAEAEIQQMAEIDKKKTENFVKKELSNYKREKNLKNSNLEKKIKAKTIEKEIHDLATKYLKNGKPRHQINALIRHHTNLSMRLGERQIARHLKTHASGLWEQK